MTDQPATDQPVTDSAKLSLFEAFGVEVEYMLVDRETLDVRPVADQLLHTAAGQASGETPTSDVEFGAATFSNELALHVLELKGTRPSPFLPNLSKSMQDAIKAVEPSLSAHGVTLLPGGMHPWMNPVTQTRLWPHECSQIYQAYHRVFDCYRHGWANVQSVHLNLPFSGDDEFSRLHAAVRLLLPILPALTASSPIVDAKPAPWADMRMQFVRDHCDAVPILTGDIVPEAIFDEATYRTEVFGGLRTAIAAHDDSGVFDPHFLNARGAIARFDRGSIEIRVMDVQECPAADVGVCELVVEVLKEMVRQRWRSLADQQQASTKSLAMLLDRVCQSAEATVIDDSDYLKQFGIREPSISAGQLWQRIAESIGYQNETTSLILDQGSLSTRILAAVGDDWRQENLRSVYRTLGNCLREGVPFKSN